MILSIMAPRLLLSPNVIKVISLIKFADYYYRTSACVRGGAIMADLSIDICCPQCSTCIDVKLTELRMGGSTICPKCGASVKFRDADLCKVQGEVNRIEGIAKKIEA